MSARERIKWADASCGLQPRGRPAPVFVSAWLRDYHTARWFDVLPTPFERIRNGAAPRGFSSRSAHALWKPGEPLRIETHHWSDNPAKGFAVYEAMDTAIAEEQLRTLGVPVSLERWPENIHWRAARTFPACSGHRLAGGTPRVPCGGHRIATRTGRDASRGGHAVRSSASRHRRHRGNSGSSGRVSAFSSKMISGTPSIGCGPATPA